MSAPETTAFRGGIIAAGQGSRLRDAGLAVPKPLVSVAGQPMLFHVLNNFRSASIDHISIIFNEDGGDCVEWIEANAGDMSIDLTVKTTPSSFASFKLISNRLAGYRAIVSTVDAWIPDQGFARFAASVAELPADSLVLGVSERVDDEKPLWVELDSMSGLVDTLGGTTGDVVTAGVYALPPDLTFPKDVEFARLRDYLRWIVDGGRPVYGIPIPNVVDLDRTEDIEAAEDLAATEMSDS